MKPLKKLTVFTLVTAIVLSLFSFSAITGSAVVEIMDGDFSYVSNSDGTFALYHYYGSETSIELPSEVFETKVTSVYSGAFEDSDIVSVTIPENYTAIAENAFFGCEKLTDIALPKSLVKIGNNAFSGCSSLNTVFLPENSALNEVGYSAFSGNEALTSFTFPSKLTKISSNAFAGSAVSEALISNSVTTLGDGVFKDCAALENVTLPESLTNIPDNTFSGCTALNSVKIPKKVTEIGSNAFYNCSSLSEIEFPNALTKIGASAFENATSLTELFISDNVSDIGANAFYPMSIQKTLKVTCYENSYAADYCYENWVEYEAVEKLIGDVNLDGICNILDVSVIQKYKIGETDIPTERAKALADVNNDGSITIRDATLIQMKLAKIIDEF